ncbi:NAD(+) kinase [Methylomonas sp. SURF-1]|uniref:NAD kinase n=1 Tax=Methylomonas aurea TaxID=2952224 RepID=A0ABT1UD99_9GAMM|nr:NAD(+) kinase [Methylomonas sp. SURF-1]MCQ8180204.1 NAD(+) kinase [Methylomonas sp. SURF-1]
MPSPFQRIGLVGKFGDPGIAPTLNQLYRYLLRRGFQVAVESQSADLIENAEVTGVYIERLPEHCDLMIALGGDGTFLAAARAVADFDVPLLGVNLGRLGFLADISPEQLSGSLEQILAGNYITEQRHLLNAAIIRDGTLIHQQTAVNEVVVHRWVTPSMIEIVTSIDGIYLNTQRSDGLIVATPTGSTAYSLSAGGPILHPALHALVLVPLNPHTLSNRPLVIDDNVTIEVRFSRAKQINALVTCDHLEIPDVRINDKIVIKKAEKPIKILHPADHDFFHILRSKLNWSGYPA